MFDMPPDAVPIVLNVDVPDRVLTASVQAAGASVAALYLAWPGPGDGAGHQAQIRQAISFAVKAVLIAAGPHSGPLPRAGVPGGAGVPYAGPRAPPVFA